MKKLLFLAFAGFLVFQACDLISDETETVVFDKEKAGMLHNQLLDHVATQVHIGRASDQEISTVISDLIIEQAPEKERTALRAALNATPHANLDIYADFNEWLSSESRVLLPVEKQYLQRLVQLGEAASHQENFDFESNQYRRGSKYEGGFTPETYLKFYRSTRNFFFSFLRLSPYYNEKIDDSLVDAFDQAFKSGAKVLNFSMILASITDPLSDYRIPEPLLQKITQGLVANDQILVMAANNQGRNLSEYKNQVYFKQFSENADISSRMLIVMNVYIGKKGKKIKRFYTSNWPGKDLSNYTVSAFGKDVVSGYSLKGSEVFRAVSGTSQAAPKVAGFCLLVEQFFKDSSQEITSCGIVDFVKRTARPLGDPEIFGKGLINPDALLNEVRLFSSP